MKVRFLEAEQIRDPKSGEIISSFEKGQEVELSPAGAAYFFAKKTAEPVLDKPVEKVAAEPVPEVQPAAFTGKRSRL